MLLSHYAPGVEAYLVVAGAGAGAEGGLGGPAQQALEAAQPPPAPFPPALVPWSVVVDVGGRLGALQPVPGTHGGTGGRALAYVDLSPRGSLREARVSLFGALRWAEAVPGARAVLLCDPRLLLPAPSGQPSSFTAAGPAESVAAGVKGAEHCDALRDRMFRAASGRGVTLLRT